MTTARYEGWPPAAMQLVERACQRHGGWERFERLREVSADILEVAGPMLTVQGLGRSFSAPGSVRVEPHALRTTFPDWPGPGREGRFAAGSVCIAASAEAAQPGPSHRGAMPRLGWGPLDALYFFGYALSNYLALPFLLASTRLVGVRPGGVVVEFPAGFDTHSQRQAFYFGEDGLLCRHDYTAGVVGPWAMGSHFSSDYACADGLWFATRRRVVVRLGQLPTPIPLLHAHMGGFAVGSTTSGPSDRSGFR